MTEIPPEAVGVPAYLHLHVSDPDTGETRIISISTLVPPALLEHARAAGGIYVNVNDLHLVAA